MLFIKEIKNQLSSLDTSLKQLKKFSILFSVLFLGLSVWFYFQANNWWLLCLMMGLFFIAGIIWPKTVYWLYKLWMSFAIVVGFFVFRFIFTVLFYFLLTPIGVVMRFTKGDFLEKKINKNAATYWRDYKKENNKELLEKQF